MFEAFLQRSSSFVQLFDKLQIFGLVILKAFADLTVKMSKILDIAFDMV